MATDRSTTLDSRTRSHFATKSGIAAVVVLTGEWQREVAWAVRAVERSGETFEEGSEPIGAMALVAIVQDPRGRHRITRYSLTTPYTRGQDPLLTRDSFFERPTPSFLPLVHSPRLYDGQSMVVDIPTSLAFACRWQLLQRSRDIAAVHVIDYKKISLSISLGKVVLFRKMDFNLDGLINVLFSFHNLI